MPTTFVTAAQAEKQVTSHQARLSHAHTFGEGRYLLDGLELTMETSNRLKAGAGVMLIDGSYVTVDEAGQEWTVENGTQAMKRIDLAGYEYSVGEDGMESLAPKVLKGAPHATAPTMPTYAKGSLLDRPAKLFIPVAKVELDEISAKPPTCMLDTLPTVAELRDSVSRKQTRLDNSLTCYVEGGLCVVSVDFLTMQRSNESVHIGTLPDGLKPRGQACADMTDGGQMAYIAPLRYRGNDSFFGQLSVTNSGAIMAHVSVAGTNNGYYYGQLVFPV